MFSESQESLSKPKKFCQTLSVKSVRDVRPAIFSGNWVDVVPDFKVTPKPNSEYFETDKELLTAVEIIEEKRQAQPTPYQQRLDEKRLPGISRCLDENKKKMTCIIDFGRELVDSIAAVNEKREIVHEQASLARRLDIKVDSKKDAVESAAILKEISEECEVLQDWEKLQQPVPVARSLDRQRLRLAGMLKEKERIIDRCQKERQDLIDVFCSDSDKHLADVAAMAQRVDNAIELLKEVYNEDLNSLRSNAQNERARMERAAAIRIKAFYREMTKNELEKTRICEEKEMIYSRKLVKVWEEHNGITRAARIRLEREAEVLQFEISKIKHAVLMSSEKLDYNYQVLTQRNEENVVIHNQQKRRVAKMAEDLAKLKKKVIAVSSRHDTNIARLSDEINKVHTGIRELQAKAEQFRKLNKARYNSICDINLNEIQSVLGKVLLTDKIMHEQLLALPWSEPELDLVFKDMNPVCSLAFLLGSRRINGPGEGAVDWNMLKRILHKISERAGFLVEQKLLRILEDYDAEESCIVRLDNIFAALNINDMDAVSALVSFFEPFCWCPNCEEDFLPDAFHALFLPKLKFSRRIMHRKPKRTTNCTDHHLVIEPFIVIPALKHFAQQNNLERRRMKSKHKKSGRSANEIVHRVLTKDDWQYLHACVSADTETLWRALGHSMTHYLHGLQRRAQLDRDVQFLRKQNSEFLHMFQRVIRD